MLHKISLAVLLLVSLNAVAANYVVEADTSSYGYGPISSPAGEQYFRAVDGSADSKYLNFNKTGAGITVGFANARIMRRLIMYTANDSNERDPMTINIYGSNTWDGAKTLIQANVATNLSTNRKTPSTIDFNNSLAYQFYTIEVTSVRNDYYANSFQFSEVLFYYDTEYNPSAPAYSSGITAAQQTRKSTEILQRNAQSGNEIYIEQAGDNNNFTLRQGASTTGKNRLEVYGTGDGNTISLNQGIYTDGTTPLADANNHYLYLYYMGNQNNITAQQITGSAAAAGHFAESTITGNNNVVNLTQQGTGSKTLFLNITGSANAVNAEQKDTGHHYLDINLTGQGHVVNALQQGSGSHAATIDLTNAGGAATLNMTQSGATAQTYSIQQSCTMPSGCSTTINQP